MGKSLHYPSGEVDDSGDDVLPLAFWSQRGVHGDYPYLAEMRK